MDKAVLQATKFQFTVRQGHIPSSNTAIYVSFNHVIVKLNVLMCKKHVFFHWHLLWMIKKLPWGDINSSTYFCIWCLTKQIRAIWAFFVNLINNNNVVVLAIMNDIWIIKTQDKTTFTHWYQGILTTIKTIGNME